MKKYCSILTLLCFFTTHTLAAQESQPPEEEELVPITIKTDNPEGAKPAVETTVAAPQEQLMPPAPKPRSAKSMEWQNWIFAATTVATVTLGVYFTSIDAGHID